MRVAMTLTSVARWRTSPATCWCASMSTAPGISREALLAQLRNAVGPPM